MPEEPTVTIYGKPGCHLCEMVESELRSVPSIGLRLKIVDIGKSPELFDKHWLRIPVVALRGTVVFEAKMMDPKGEWRKRIRSLVES